MKIVKVLGALVLTLALLVIARMASRGQPDYHTHMQNGYAFEYTTVPTGTEFSQASIALTIAGDFGSGSRAVFRRTTSNTSDINNLAAYESVPMSTCDSAADCFYTVVNTGKKNDRFYYYFEVTDTTGVTLATFTESGGSPFMFRYIGIVPTFFYVVHVVPIFATVFFVLLGVFASVSLIRGATEVKPLARYSFLAALAAFLGCYPFGIPMNYYAFGGLWEGVPFGTDATDNKTQLLFVYLLFMTLATIGSLRGKPEKDIYSPGALGWFGAGSLAVVLFIYLIPHSIQFSPALTYAFCYSWIGVVALIYIFGRIRTSRA